MAKRKMAADASQPHGRVTEEFIDQGRKNLAKGRAAREAQRAKAREEFPNRETQTQRWARLLDGSLRVHDLDDDEVKNMRVKGKDGTFNGKAPTLPSHLAQEFHREIINRAQHSLRTALGDVVDALKEIALDPEAKDSDRIKAGNIIMDRVLGRAVETVRVEGASAFDEMLNASVVLDRDVADMPGADVGEDGARP